MQRKKTLIKLLTNWQVAVGLIVVLFFVFVAVFAPQLAPHDPLYTNVRVRLQAPCPEHPLGTDDLGRDMLSRIIFGTRISLTVGFMSLIIGGSVGVLYGIIGGYYGGKLDAIMGRFVDVLLAFPGMLLAIALVTILGPNTRSVIIAISIFAVPGFSRIARGGTLSVKKLEYIDAIRALGASDLRIMIRHILPNIMSPIIVQSAMFVGGAIGTSAALAFLGIGTPPPTPEWGGLLSGGREFLSRAPHITLFPGIAICMIIIAMNMIGDGLRNALAPKD